MYMYVIDNTFYSIVYSILFYFNLELIQHNILFEDNFLHHVARKFERHIKMSHTISHGGIHLISLSSSHVPDSRVAVMIVPPCVSINIS